jgi:hypothetical protein
MVDAFIVSGEELEEEYRTYFPFGAILVVIPSGALSFSEYIELKYLKNRLGILTFPGRFIV